jgi:hypothetical protein
MDEHRLHHDLRTQGVPHHGALQYVQYVRHGGHDGHSHRIAAAERNGRAYTLIAVVPATAGYSADATPITAYLTATSNAALTIANSTTTGDATTGILGNSAGTAITTIVGPMNGIGVIAIVDETPPS